MHLTLEHACSAMHEEGSVVIAVEAQESLVVARTAAGAEEGSRLRQRLFLGDWSALSAPCLVSTRLIFGPCVDIACKSRGLAKLFAGACNNVLFWRVVLLCVADFSACPMVKSFSSAPCLVRLIFGPWVDIACKSGVLAKLFAGAFNDVLFWTIVLHCVLDFSA